MDNDPAGRSAIDTPKTAFEGARRWCRGFVLTRGLDREKSRSFVASTLNYVGKCM